MAGATAPAVDPAGADSWTLIPANRRALAGVVLALSNFMVVLDLTIANVSVPHISGDIGVSMDQGTWIVTSYAVAEAICVPLTGWLAQRFGAVRVFILSVAGFGLFSVLCGLSVSLGMLVAARIGQGLCGGPIMPMSQTLLIRVFPPERRPMALGLWAMTITAGPALGPLIGGVISDEATWHWIFFINIPVAIVCVVSGIALLRPVETPVRKVPIDRIGLALMVLWIGCLQVMLDIGRDRDWFADTQVIVLAVVGLVGFIAFVIWELTDEHPIVDIRVLRHRGFTLAVIAQSTAFGAFFAGAVVVPQYLQTTLGYSATKSGMVSGAHAFLAILMSRLVVGLVSKVDSRLLVSVGMVGLAMTALLRSQWTSDAPMSVLLWGMMSQGLAVMFFMIPLTTMALSAVKPEETATASGLQNFLRTVAVAVSTSLVLTMWSNFQTEARAGLAGRLNDQPARATLAGLGMNAQQATAFIEQTLQREVVTIGIDRVFQVAAALMVFAAMLVWMVPKPPKPGSQAPAGGH